MTGHAVAAARAAIVAHARHDGELNCFTDFWPEAAMSDAARIDRGVSTCFFVS